jgi:short-subunit dehydrogenase involved in D-alanine esterification of teichoic acids
MKNQVIDMINNLQNKAIITGTTMELSENANATELLSSLVSDVVDDTNEILNLLNNN